MTEAKCIGSSRLNHLRDTLGRESAAHLEMHVEEPQDDVKHLPLYRIRPRTVIACSIPIRVTVIGMIEAHPGRRLARFQHPFMRKLENSLGMIAIAPNVQDGCRNALYTGHGARFVARARTTSMSLY